MDFYVILGLERGATLREIKRAYRRLARRFHPDINPGDREAEAFFRHVIEAYETLNDPERRQDYDAHGATATKATPASVEFQGFDFSASADGSLASTFGDLFADVFRSRGSQGVTDRPEGGVDLHAEASLTFEEAIHGATRKITLTRLAACPVCQGAGVRRAGERHCAQCHGTGTLRWARGHMVFSKICAHCGGSGRQRDHACSTCGAEGVVPRSDRVSMQVPPGTADGTRIRIPVRVMPAAVAVRLAICTSRCTSLPIHSFGVTGTTSIWSCRWRFTKRPWGRESTCRRSTAPASCACLRGRSQASAFGCVATACRQLAMDGGAIW